MLKRLLGSCKRKSGLGQLAAGSRCSPYAPLGVSEVPVCLSWADHAGLAAGIVFGRFPRHFGVVFLGRLIFILKPFCFYSTPLF